MAYRAYYEPPLRDVGRGASVGSGSKFKRASRIQQAPRRFTVHAVDDDTGETACVAVDVDALVPYERLWAEVQPVYRCRGCHARTALG